MTSAVASAVTPGPASSHAAAALRIERVPITHPDAAALVAGVQAEYVARYGSEDETPIAPGDFELPVGAFFVGYLDDVPVASGAWRTTSIIRLGARALEVKRMYVLPAYQRRGLARRMLDHLEAEGIAQGADHLLLETGLEQPEAIALYTCRGYEPVEGFGFYCGSELSRCFARRLDAAAPLK